MQHHIQFLPTLMLLNKVLLSLTLGGSVISGKLVIFSSSKPGLKS